MDTPVGGLQSGDAATDHVDRTDGAGAAGADVDDEDPPGPVSSAPADDPAFRHVPVMADEILDVFDPVPSGVVIDATLGGAGHAARLLGHRPDLDLVGLDRDRRAVRAAVARLAEFGDRVEVQHRPFSELADVAAALDAPVAGVLFDLGVSSPQLDEADRGFSYRADGPLDMRMDPERGGPTAADLVNGLDVGALADVLRRHGDERHAGRIARAIVAARPVTRTSELAEIVRAAIPAATRRTGGHPATRTFQALRIEVNGELEMLEGALRDAIAALAPDGRIAVLSYHSGEDRIVKATLRDEARGGAAPTPAHLPPAPGRPPTIELIHRGGLTPTDAELAANPRAASARLRAGRRLGGT